MLFVSLCQSKLYTDEHFEVSILKVQKSIVKKFKHKNYESNLIFCIWTTLDYKQLCFINILSKIINTDISVLLHVFLIFYKNFKLYIEGMKFEVFI